MPLDITLSMEKLTVGRQIKFFFIKQIPDGIVFLFTCFSLCFFFIVHSFISKPFIKTIQLKPTFDLHDISG